ncbi:MAG: peptide deformylase [bacterium]|nr:peptide deformylase [bacterium]
MAILKIHYYGDPILEKPTALVKNITGREIALIEDMFETMYALDGVGLAANQVGFNNQIVVVDPSRGQLKKERFILINPKIIYYSHKTNWLKEGCLSFPEIEGNVERAISIGICALDLNGKQIELDVKELLARIFQHEIDHVNGIMFIEKMSQFDRQMIEGKLKKLKKETLAKLKHKKLP